MANLFLGKKVVLLLLVGMMMMMILFQEVSLVEAAARPLIGMRLMGIGRDRGGGHNMIKMFETLGIRTCKCCMINYPNQQQGGGAGNKSGGGDHEYSCKTIYISDQLYKTSTATTAAAADCFKLECLPWKL